MNTSTAYEIERLMAVELEAERRHGGAMKRGDFSAARNAELDWIRASDTLTEYVAAHQARCGDSV